MINKLPLAFFPSIRYDNSCKQRKEDDNQMTEFYWSPLADLEDLIYEYQSASDR